MLIYAYILTLKSYFWYVSIYRGAYRPRDLHGDVHCDPEEAVRMHTELQSKRSLSIHWVCYTIYFNTYCIHTAVLISGHNSDGLGYI